MSSAAIHHRQRGLTLLEMLVAMTIMALSITVIYRAIAGSARGVEQVGESAHAVQIIQSLLLGLPTVVNKTKYFIRFVNRRFNEAKIRSLRKICFQ